MCFPLLRLLLPPRDGTQRSPRWVASTTQRLLRTHGKWPPHCSLLANCCSLASLWARVLCCLVVLDLSSSYSIKGAVTNGCLLPSARISRAGNAYRREMVRELVLWWQLILPSFVYSASSSRLFMVGRDTRYNDLHSTCETHNNGE